jgi:choline dehydrogenase-like flavoprotein
VPQGYACDEFLRDGALVTAAQPDVNVVAPILPCVGRTLMHAVDSADRMAHFALLVRDEAPGGRVWRDVGGFPAITYNVTPGDMATLHRAMVHTAEMCLAAGATSFRPSVMGASLLEGARGLDELRRMTPRPSDVLWTSYHPLGSCRMGSDPKTSVIDKDHETHEVRGLFVVDGSAVRGPLGVNPQLTIMALATRAAEKIAERTA